MVWPPQSFSASGSADAGQRFVSADRVIVGSAIVVSIAARKHDESSAAEPIVDTSRVWKAGWIIVRGSSCTGNDSGRDA